MEKELEAYCNDLCLQRDIEIKLFKEKLEKEGKKKAAALTEEIDNVENIERKAFEKRLNEKIREIKRENDKLVEDEKRKNREKIEREILAFQSENEVKKEKMMEFEKNSTENQKKRVLIQIEELNELILRQQNINDKLEEDYKEQLRQEEYKKRREVESMIEEYKRDQEYELEKKMISARNRKSQVTLQEKIKEIKEDYKVRKEVEIRNELRAFEDNLKDLYLDS